jgi:hypothetical protein
VGSLESGSGTTRYYVVVRGQLDSALTSLLDCVSVGWSGGLTELAFDVSDCSHLGGILDRLRDLAVDVVSAEVVPGSDRPAESRLAITSTGARPKKELQWIEPERSWRSGR